MIPFPDIDTLDAGTDPWPGAVARFALDDRPLPLVPLAAPLAAPVAAPEPASAVAPGRSLFDDDFDLPAPPEPREEPEIIEPSFSLAEYEAARDEGFRAGEEAAREAADAARNAAEHATLAAIAASLDAVRDDAAQVVEDAATAIGGLLMDMLAAVFPALCARFGAAETQAVIRTILPVLRQEPRATVRIAPDLVAPVVETITRVDADLVARIDIEPDPTVPDGDVRVTWRHGEARRDVRALWRDIGDILGQTGWPVPPPPVATIPVTMKEPADVE